MSCDPEYIKTLRNVKPEPDYCKQLRQRNLYGAKRKGFDKLRKIDSGNANGSPL